MNVVETERWMTFQSAHKGAKELFYEVHPVGVGSAIIAVAIVHKKRKATSYDKRIEKNITDYDCW